MNKAIFLFLIGLCCFFLGIHNSYGQSGCGIKLYTTGGERCDNHNLTWDPVPEATGYNITTTYDGSIAVYSTEEPSIDASVFGNDLLEIPGSIDSDTPYKLIIKPHNHQSGTNPNNSRANLIVFCISEFTLDPCHSLSLDLGDEDTTTGGSKSFVPFDDGGGTAIPLPPSSTPSPFKTNNPTQAPIQVHIAPNPVDADLYITTTTPQATKATMTIYNTNGQQMLQLSNQQALDKGTQVAKYDVSELPTGIYYYVLQTGETRISQKIVKM